MKKLFLIVFAEIFVFASSALLSRRSDVTSDIIGGVKAGKSSIVNFKRVISNTGEFPYMAFIEMYGKHQCGGAIIRLDMVFTAAHCLIDGISACMINVRAGSFIREDKTGEYMQESQVAKYLKHPLYRTQQLLIDYDIAVLKLITPFIRSEYVKHINLPERRNIEQFIDEKAIIIGVGETEDGTPSKDLMKAKVRVISRADCQKLVKGIITDVNMCAVSRKKVAMPCNGDSGGPLIKRVSENPEDDILIGITSVTIKTQDSFCSTKHPSIYTDVASLRNWIDHRLMTY